MPYYTISFDSNTKVFFDRMISAKCFVDERPTSEQKAFITLPSIQDTKLVEVPETTKDPVALFLLSYIDRHHYDKVTFVFLRSTSYRGNI